MGKLKKKVTNKARVEGSICNAYIMEEAATFFSHYFEDHVKTVHRNIPRNDEGVEDKSDKDLLSIFKKQGRPSGAVVKAWMKDDEYNAARSYILQNCIEVEPFIR